MCFRNGVLRGQTHGVDRQQSFCIDIGPTCIRGRLTVSVDYTFYVDYQVRSVVDLVFNLSVLRLLS